jgi:predicted ribosome quality control (RQC) complex YloA/Tae2 family protein
MLARVRTTSVQLSLVLIQCIFWDLKAFGIRGTSFPTLFNMPRRTVATVPRRAFVLTRLNCQSEQPSLEEKVWNIKGLKFEVARKQSWAFKKVEKVTERIRNLEAKQLQAPDSTNEDEITKAKADLEEQQKLLTCLNDLNENLQCVKSASDPFFKAMIPDIVQLEISDTPTQKPKSEQPVQIKKKEVVSPRLPYRVYESVDGIEIRVGKGAEDNDELSCNPRYRDGAYWWMHVSGSPGSHVVICSTDDNLLQTHRQTVIDAALLTAIHSKAQGGRVHVSLTRCRNVSKPAGAKAGLVQLRGDIVNVAVDVKAESKRLEYLKRK